MRFARGFRLQPGLVYATDDVRLDEDAREIVLARLRDEMGLPFVNSQGAPVITTSRLAAERVGARRGLGRAGIAQLEAHPVAARAMQATFRDRNHSGASTT